MKSLRLKYPFQYVGNQYQGLNIPVLITSKELGVDPVQPNTGLPWSGLESEILRLTEELLPVHGAILFRDFTGGVGNQMFCNEFAKLFGKELLSYDFGSTPRTDLGDGVYTATEYPAHQVIPLHNEQSYTQQWPKKIWFHCVVQPEVDGETPIADSRNIYQKIPSEIRERFDNKKLLYVRNYGNGLDLPWTSVFNTDSREQVESYCRQNAIEFMWKEDGELKTWQRCQATARHHTTNEWVWFNQAHLFHVSNLEESARETLLDIVELEDLPRYVYYGDGSEIEDSILEHIRGVLDEEKVLFPWQEGDIMMLDNMLVAHGRSTFSGKRKIVVAMADAFDSTQR